jgi:hypothetical protein
LQRERGRERERESAEHEVQVQIPELVPKTERQRVPMINSEVITHNSHKDREFCAPAEAAPDGDAQQFGLGL